MSGDFCIVIDFWWQYHPDIVTWRGSCLSVSQLFLCQVENTWSVHFLDHVKHQISKCSEYIRCSDCPGSQKVVSMGHLVTSLQAMFPFLFWGLFSVELTFNFFFCAQQTSWIKQHLVLYFVLSCQGHMCLSIKQLDWQKGIGWCSKMMEFQSQTRAFCF